MNHFVTQDDIILSAHCNAGPDQRRDENMRLLYFGAVVALMAPSSVFAAPCNVANSIVMIKNSRSGGFEYVDFWVKKPVTGPVTTSVSSTGSFEHDASGGIINVTGNRWRVIRFSMLQWHCSIWQNFTLPKLRIKDIQNIGQFEGVITYAIGRQNGSYLGMTVTNFAVNRRYRFKFN
jgi:hypothetical protein